MMFEVTETCVSPSTPQARSSSVLVQSWGKPGLYSLPGQFRDGLEYGKMTVALVSCWVL